VNRTGAKCGFIEDFPVYDDSLDGTMNRRRERIMQDHRCTAWKLCLAFLLACPTALPAEEAECDPGPVRLVLPPVLYAVPGVEMNVYFDNVVLVIDPDDYVFDVTCQLGIQQHERWTYMPAAGDVGSYPLVIEVRDGQNQVIARAATKLEVVAAGAGEGRAVSALLIGDSLTHASIYSQHLLERCKQPGNPQLTLIGSHNPEGRPPENRHEGYGGWTALRFATHYTGVAREGDAKKRGSPFLYQDAQGKGKLDFARYLQDIGAKKAPEFVTIFLGPNDIFAATDETIEESIDTMLTNYDLLLAMVREVSAETRLGVMLPAPPAATQDAFGANYKTGQTRWQYKRNQHRLVERMLQRYGGRESDGIYLVPTQVNLDCMHNYPTATGKWNATAEAEGARLTNGVHPAASGYLQIGDTLYAWMKAQLGSPSQ
jgi:lysophospholipase L1-like esterase